MLSLKPKKLSSALIKLVPYIIAIASAFTAFLPPPEGASLAYEARRLADILALNVRHNEPGCVTITVDEGL